MSFLYDPQVMIELVKAAFEKAAQVVAPDLTVSRIGEQNALAKKLVARLSQQISTSSGGQTTTPSSSQSIDLSRITSNLPLSMTAIDFNRINLFFDEAIKVFKNPKLNSFYTQIKPLMAAATALTNSGDSSFSMNLAPDQFVDYVKGPNRAGSYTALIDSLKSILRVAYGAVAEIMSRNRSSLNQDVLNDLETQTSIYRRNNEQLLQLASKVNYVK